MRNQWDESKKNNPRFSLRAYARKLDMEPSSLSQILRGKRDLPLTDAHKIMARLKLNSDEQKNFIESLDPHSVKSTQVGRYLATPVLDQRFNEIVVRVIEDWLYGAVFSLIGTEDFSPDFSWQAQRLGVSEERLRVVWEDLLTIGLIKKEGKSFVKGSADLKTSDDVLNASLQKAHFDELKLAHKALEEIPLELRDFTSMILAIDSKKMKDAKLLIRSFMKQMDELLEVSSCDEVYQLNIQFYPLTKKTYSRKSL